MPPALAGASPSSSVRPFTGSTQALRLRGSRCNALLGLFSGPAGRGAGTTELPDADQPQPEFRQWLQEQGVPPQPLLLRDCGLEGRGLVARRALRKGEQLLQLPESLLLTAEVAARESCMAPLLSRAPGGGLPDWSVMALYLAELRSRAAAGDSSSRWAPYVAILPQRPGTVLDWPAKEVTDVLRGSPLQRKAQSILSAAAASWQELEPLVAQARAEGLLPRQLRLAKADIDWALGVLLSRCVRLPGRGQLQALVPWADLLNHDVHATCHLDWSGAAPAPGGAAGAGSLVLTTDRDYQPGQQVYNSYGPKSSGELLLGCGFCPPPAANPHEAYALQLRVDPQDPLAELKEEALAKHGLPSEVEFPLKLGGLPEGLLQYAALTAARPKVAQETLDLAAYLFERGEFPVLDGEDTLGLALRAVAGMCGNALKAYPTSAEVDRALAAKAPPPPSRRRAATATAAPAAPQQQQQAQGSGDLASQRTLGTEEVAVVALRQAAVAGIRLQERVILQRAQYIASSQATELKRTGANQQQGARRR